MTFDAPMPPPPPPTIPALADREYANWLYRVGAYIVDAVPAWILSGIGFAVGGFSVTTTTNPYTGVTTSTTSAPGPLYWICILLSFAYFIWNVVIRQGSTGQTIGKSVLGIKLVKESTGQPVGRGLSFGRALLHIVDALPCFIGYLWPLWDKKRQTFADKIVSSVVIKVGQ